MTGHSKNSAVLILGNQLFEPQHLPPAADGPVFMAEDVGLCTYEKHHQQKIVLFLAAMRAYADELRDAGYEVHYEELDPSDTTPFVEKLGAFLKSMNAEVLHHFEIEDKAFESSLVKFADKYKLQRHEISSPMFLCSRDEFAKFADGKERLLMADFYKRQRRHLNILVDKDGNPEGGQWSYDADNRKRLPKDISPPEIDWPKPDKHVSAVQKLVAGEFEDHPGEAADFRWPTTRKQAKRWLQDFIDERLENFGPYEDAITQRSDTVFHSLLSPCINMGLLTPQDMIDSVCEQRVDAPIQSIEGFVRQVAGWREFVRGIYRQHSDTQDEANFWSHKREMTGAWYDGTTGIPPLDDTIATAQKSGWAHHIPRLMILGNLMTLCEIRPQSAHRWFMEMFVDSSEWVMGPNVYGMALFSDGGIFATKPYICGSNYLLKMSDYKKGDWCDTVDGLYWRFIDKHRDFFESNHRLALMPKALDRLKSERREKIFSAAEAFIDSYTD